MTADNIMKPRIGEGIYNVPEAARILALPQYKVRRLVKDWNEVFGKDKNLYSWGKGGATAFNFLTLIEFYVFYQLKNAGVKTKEIRYAHEILSNHLQTFFPFASATLLTDGGKILFQLGSDDILDIDPAFQYNFREIIEPFCTKIEFEGQLARRFYPLGKEKSIVVDPRNQFGQPTIEGTNVMTATLYSMHQSGEGIEKLVKLYNLKKDEVNQAIEFYKQAA